MKTGLARGEFLFPAGFPPVAFSVGSFAGVVLVAHGDLAAFSFQFLQRDTTGSFKNLFTVSYFICLVYTLLEV